MKILLVFLIFLSLSTHAQPIQLDDHRWSVTDIGLKGLTKEGLFKSMNSTLVRTWDSICSNRAEVWAYDFRRRFELDSAKIFLFYTPENAGKWWYHAAPVLNEGHQLWVMDAGFPSSIRAPLSVSAWLKQFTGSNGCHEIRATEKELIRLIHKSQAFPRKTSYGTHDCYYALAPEGYWTPGQLAKGLLGEDEEGRPIHFLREQVQKDEAYEACLEVSTSPLGWAWGSGIKKCNYFMSQL